MDCLRIKKRISYLVHRSTRRGPFILSRCLLIVHIPAQVETVQSLATSIRGGSVGNHQFSKIVYVGHSFGSELGNAHAANYPADVDANILTGYTPFIKNGMLSTHSLASPVPASIAMPDRFGSLPPNCLAASTQKGIDHPFFYVSAIDPDLLELSWTSRGTVAMGELVTTLFSPSIVPKVCWRYIRSYRVGRYHLLRGGTPGCWNVCFYGWRLWIRIG